MENINNEITKENLPTDAKCAFEAPIEEVKEAAAETAPVVMMERSEFEMLINGFKAYYDAILRTVKATKEKDSTIAKITKELQKYREGYAKSMTKPIANSLVSFLEDNKKTLREFDSFAKDKESVLKYLDYLMADAEAMLELYDIAKTEDGFTVKNKPIGEWQEPASFELPEPQAPVDRAMPTYDSEINSLSAALEFMKMGQSTVEEAVRDTALLDANLDVYATIAANVDKHNASALLMPIYRKLTELYTRITVAIECAKEDIAKEDSDFREIYSAVLKSTVDYTYELLVFVGVSVIDDISDEFDAKTSKILNIVNTDNPELDKKVCTRYTSCYQFDGAVIYPAKVSVYKFVQ